MPCCEIHPRVMTPQDEQRELEGDPLDWLPPAELHQLSHLASFYDGASVFITGATGFIGSLLLEKLLRTCTGVTTVYVLVRDKQGVPLRERLRSHLEKLVFSRARKECPDYVGKVVPIAGDCAQPGLGLSPADAAELAGKVSVVFHLAATVRFDADLRTAAITNVASTCDVMALIRCWPSLKAFVYMSTAYSNVTSSDIDEKFYPPAMTADELLKLVRVMDDEKLSQILPLILGDWPNTYSFTKAIAEDVVRVQGVGLPVSIIRPSIVVSTYREPIALWAGSLYGPTAVWMGVSAGLIHTVLCNSTSNTDVMPADLVVNATIACAWDTWCRHRVSSPTDLASREPMIYNCVSSARHPVTWNDIQRFGTSNINHQSIKTIWYPFGFMFKRKLTHDICAVLFHLIPAIVADTFLRIKGKKPILWRAYARIHGLFEAVSSFTTTEWNFRDDNLVSLMCRLESTDRKLFPFDIVDVDWDWYFATYLRGCRLYILNESFDNLEEARRKYRWLRILHYTLVTTVCSLLVLLLL